MTEWSGTITSTRRIVNRVLGASDQYAFVDPNTSGQDRSDVFFTTEEHLDTDVPDDDVAAEEDDINGASLAAGTSTDVKPDEHSQPKGDGVAREQN